MMKLGDIGAGNLLVRVAGDVAGELGGLDRTLAAGSWEWGQGRRTVRTMTKYVPELRRAVKRLNRGEVLPIAQGRTAQLCKFFANLEAGENILEGIVA